MKYCTWLITLLAAVTVMLAGCSKKTGVDTAKLQSAFKTTDATTSSSISKAVVAIESEDYSGAMSELKKIAANAKLTPEQQQAVKDTIDQITKMLGDKAKEAVGAAGDLQKNLPK